jgi:hypothetical protein
VFLAFIFFARKNTQKSAGDICLQTYKSIVTASGSVGMHSKDNGKKLIGDIFYFHVAYLQAVKTHGSLQTVRRNPEADELPRDY